MVTLDAPETIEVEVFAIDSVTTSERVYEGHQAQEAWGSYASETRTLEAGTIKISMDQPLARVAFTLLEPRSDDGFVAWGFLANTLQAGAAYPILRGGLAHTPPGRFGRRRPWKILQSLPKRFPRDGFRSILRVFRETNCNGCPVPGCTPFERETMRRIAILALLASPCFLACSDGVPLEEAVASINEADFLAKISVIADDSMMGRANPSPGLNMTAQWIAEEFESYGLKPGGGDGTFIQKYPVRETGPDFEASSAQVTGGPALEFGTDLNFMRGSGSGEVTGSVVVLAGTWQGPKTCPPNRLLGST